MKAQIENQLEKWLLFNRLLQLHLICCPPSPKVINTHTNNVRATSNRESPTHTNNAITKGKSVHMRPAHSLRASKSVGASKQKPGIVEGVNREPRPTPSCEMVSRRQGHKRKGDHAVMLNSPSHTTFRGLVTKKKRESLERVSPLKHAESDINEAISPLQRVRNLLRKLHHHWSVQR